MMLRGYLSSQGEGGKICSGRPKVATCPLGPNDRHIVKWQELNLQQKQQQQHWEDDERREGGVMRILAFAIVVFAALATMELPTTAKKRVALVPIDAELSSRSPGSLSRQEEGALKAKDEFKECEKCPMMVVVPAGSFTMGSPQSEPGRYYDEGPQHHVTFAKPFAVGKFTVTFDEWNACVADGGCNGYRPEGAGWGRGKRPVISVSWEDAKSYAESLSRKTGKPYRLLNESEWEYIARAGTTTPFWWGSSISPSRANYDGTVAYNGGAKGEYRKKTMPVDSFAPNPWGLYQVHGNVWQWVEDCYGQGYQGAPGDGSAKNDGDCSPRVIRGGSWNSYPGRLRAAGRDSSVPGSRYSDNGFRVARTLTP